MLTGFAIICIVEISNKASSLPHKVAHVSNGLCYSGTPCYLTVKVSYHKENFSFVSACKLFPSEMSMRAWRRMYLR